MPRSDVRGKRTGRDDVGGGCPAEAALVQFVDGALAAEERVAIEEHIDRCGSCAEQVFALADDLPAEGDTPRAGRYVLGAELGRGGMGVVREAFDPLLERRVAVKLIHERAVADRGPASSVERETAATGSCTRIDRERLRDEARALAHLAHPNIVEVFDVGTRDDGVFVAMELIEGQSLRRWSEATVRAWPEVLAVYIAAAEGLAAAHRLGIVHGDFKPDNVLRSDDGRVKVVDFGLAQPASDQPAEESTEIFGTPAYLAPECWRTPARTPASDQFALFVALYEALWSRRPFGHGRRRLAGLHASMVAGIDHVPTKPAVPRALAEAILRGLRCRPEERFPDLRTAIAEPRRIEATVARRGHVRVALVTSVVALGVGGLLWAAAEPRAAAQRERLAAACLADAAERPEAWDDDARDRVARSMATAAPQLGSATFERIDPMLQAQSDRLAQDYAEVCRVSDRELLARREACLDERRDELLATIDVLADSDAEVVVAAVQSAATLSSSSRCTEDAWLAAEPELPSDVARRSEVLAVRRQLLVAERLGATARNRAGLELAEQAMARAEALGDAPTLARARLTLGLRRAQAGDWAVAEAELQAAYFATIEIEDRVSAARSATALAQLLGKRLGRVDEGLAWCRHADALLASAATSDGELTALHLVTCASVLIAAGRPTQAIVDARRGLAIRVEQFGTEHPLVAAAHSALGAGLSADNRDEEAFVEFAAAKAIFEGTGDHRHPDVATMLSNMASIELRRGRYAEGRALAEEALAIREALLGLDHVDVATTLSAVAWAAFSDDDLDTAAKQFRRALTIRETSLGANHPTVATTLANLSIVVRAQGNCADAIELAARAHVIAEAHGEPARAISAQLGLAEARAGCGDHELALAAFSEARQRAEQVGSRARPEELRALAGIGQSELALGRSERAVEPLRAVVEEQLTTRQDPLTLSANAFRLAQALHETHGDRRDAIDWALLAHVDALAAGARGWPAARTIEAWLADIEAGDDAVSGLRR